MEKKLKLICIVLVGALVISGGYNFYQYKKLNNHKNELAYVARKHIQKFAGTLGNTEDTCYAQQYASIVAAQEAYIASKDKLGTPPDEWEFSLARLFIDIKKVMINDRIKFYEALDETEGAALMFKISDDFEDKESIKKVQELLGS